MNLQGLVWACLAATALAHGGHEAVPEGESISKDPIVRDHQLPKQFAFLTLSRTERYGPI